MEGGVRFGGEGRGKMRWGVCRSWSVGLNGDGNWMGERGDRWRWGGVLGDRAGDGESSGGMDGERWRRRTAIGEDGAMRRTCRSRGAAAAEQGRRRQ